MFKPIYIKQSHGQKSQANAYRNGKKHALKVALEVENSCQDKVYQQGYHV
jgi:hypothetical protein